MVRESMSLATLARGAAVERFDDELAKVLENIADPNTAPKAARSITLKVVIQPDEDRKELGIAISATSKVASTKVVKAFARFGIGPSGPVAIEDMSRQQPLFPPEDEDPGKVVSMSEAKEGGK